MMRNAHHPYSLNFQAHNSRSPLPCPREHHDKRKRVSLDVDSSSLPNMNRQYCSLLRDSKRRCDCSPNQLFDSQLDRDGASVVVRVLASQTRDAGFDSRLG